MVKPSKGFNHEYERHGTISLFAALNVATGQVKAGPHPRRRHREFLDFMNEVVADYPRQEIHVVLDHLSSHKPQRDRWRNRYPQCIGTTRRRMPAGSIRWKSGSAS